MTAELTYSKAVLLIGGIERHCETTRPNDECPYLELRCLGCSNPNGPRLEERSVHDLVRNRLLRLPEEADEIDRRAAAAGITREAQIIKLREQHDPQYRAVMQLVAVGIEQERAETAVAELAEKSLEHLEEFTRALCLMAQRGHRIAAGFKVADGFAVTEGEVWRYMSPVPLRQPPDDLATMTVLALPSLPDFQYVDKRQPGRRHGKRAQRRAAKPWAR